MIVGVFEAGFAKRHACLFRNSNITLPEIKIKRDRRGKMRKHPGRTRRICVT